MDLQGLFGCEWSSCKILNDYSRHLSEDPPQACNQFPERILQASVVEKSAVRHSQEANTLKQGWQGFVGPTNLHQHTQFPFPFLKFLGAVSLPSRSIVEGSTEKARHKLFEGHN